MTHPVLRVEQVSKSFGGIRALDDVSIEIRASEVVGLIGANGSGKSTLLKVLSGLCQPDSGRITLRGEILKLKGVADAAKAGIGMVFQELSLLPNLSVAENIMLGHEDAALRAGFYDWKALRALAAVQLGKLGSRISPSARTDSLSFAEQQVVELAKVLAIEERSQNEPVILLDEPTSMLDAAHIEAVLEQIDRLRGRSSVLFVTHRLDEALRVCDRIYVLSEGRCVAQRDRANFSIADLQQHMFGHKLGVARSDPGESSHPKTKSGLSVRALCRLPSYRDISFDLSNGEILGIAGVAGSGRESLCRALFGIEPPDSGEIVLDGQTLQLGEPADAVRLGIGYVPAERRIEGIVAGLSILENMTLVHLGGLCRGPFLDHAREKALVTHWIKQLHITPGAAATPAQHLSGGNQQKVVLAKWLVAGAPKILILDHPLRGLDVGAQRDITLLIRELAQSGIGILLIADTYEELITLSDSIIVMKDGVVSGHFPAATTKPSELQILERMT